MAAVRATTALKGAAVKPRAARTGLVCRASMQKKAAAAVAGLSAAITTHPALALVDNRMNGDGVGLPFGVNDSALAYAIVGMFGLVWAVFYVSTKDLGSFDDEESGLTL